MNDEERETANDVPLLNETPAPAIPELGRKAGQYHLRSGTRQVGEIASGEGVVAPSGQTGRADAPPAMVFHSVDARTTDSGEEFTEARAGGEKAKDSDADRYDTRSVASVASFASLGSHGRRPGTGRKLPVVVDGVVARHPPSSRHRYAGKEAEKKDHHHSPPPSFEDMTWEELDAYRRIHRQFRRRAMAERAQKSSSRNELLTREGPSDFEGESTTRGRPEPESSTVYENASVRPGTGATASRTVGVFSHSGSIFTCIL